jgi:hypothetical protein
MSLPTPVTKRSRPRYVSWSYSKLKNWRTCPRRHYHADIAKDFREDDTSDAIQYGKAVHEALAQRIKAGTPIPKHLANADPGLEKWAVKVVGEFQSAINFEWKNPGQKLLVENQLAITKDFGPCEWFDKKVPVWHRSVLDVIKINGPVALSIDWKTGKITEESEQLLISTQCVFAHFPEVQVVRTKFVWLKEDAETTLDVTREHMPMLWAKLLPELAQYEKAVTENNFPPRPNELCGRWCPVLSCEHNGRGNG